MTSSVNATHDPELASWVESANDPSTDFPIQNLPFGVGAPQGSPPDAAGACVAIGDQALSLRACDEVGLFDDLPDDVRAAVRASRLDAVAALGRAERMALRTRLGELLSSADTRHREAAASALFPIAGAELRVPTSVPNYTDFYCSIFHATNVGSMFRPDNPLLPNYKYVPIGYHGRASSLVASGTPIRRPLGQTVTEDSGPPTFGPSKLLDYEMEVGMFVGRGNRLGEPIPVERAEEHVFGLCLVNDWSARDLQKWEYQPLGPFLAKSFATTVSPWVVTLEALAPFRSPAFVRPEGDPEPLPYLASAENAERGGVDLTLEVYLATERMRAEGVEPHMVSRGSFDTMYWTLAQMLAHHASNGCNMVTGDLIASGTVSGPEKSSRGCLLEMTWRGRDPVELPTGEIRRFLQDGDEVVMRGYCEREGFRRVGFGECRGVVVPAASPVPER